MRSLVDRGLVSRIHRKKPKGKPMPANVARANGAKSKVRAGVEHVFARQKGPMGLFVRTIGIARATVKIGLANCLQHEARPLAERAGGLRLTPGRRPRKSTRVLIAPVAPATAPSPNKLSQRQTYPTEPTVIGGVQLFASGAGQALRVDHSTADRDRVLSEEGKKRYGLCKKAEARRLRASGRSW